MMFYRFAMGSDKPVVVRQLLGPMQLRMWP